MGGSFRWHTDITPTAYLNADNIYHKQAGRRTILYLNRNTSESLQRPNNLDIPIYTVISNIKYKAYLYQISFTNLNAMPVNSNV